MEYNSLSALKSKNPFDSAYFMSKRKVSVEDKTYAVNLYLDGKESQLVLFEIKNYNVLCGGAKWTI